MSLNHYKILRNKNQTNLVVRAVKVIIVIIQSVKNGYLSKVGTTNLVKSHGLNVVQ